MHAKRCTQEGAGAACKVGVQEQIPKRASKAMHAYQRWDCRSKTWGVHAKRCTQDEAEGCKANDAPPPHTYPPPAPPQAHLFHLQQEAVDEVAGVAGLQALGVAADAAGDETAHGFQQRIDFILRAREVLQQRLTHLIELFGGGRGGNRGVGRGGSGGEV